MCLSFRQFSGSTLVLSRFYFKVFYIQYEASQDGLVSVQSFKTKAPLYYLFVADTSKEKCSFLQVKSPTNDIVGFKFTGYNCLVDLIMHETPVVTLMIYVHFRADEWDINKWAWEGVLKVVSKGENCSIRLEDKDTGVHPAHN